MSNTKLYAGLHHVSLLVTDLSRATNFYLSILGLEQDLSRPEMAFPGIWLNIGQQQIHLICLGKVAAGSAENHPGRDAHCAISVKDINRIEGLLTKEGIDFHNSKSGRNAIFCRDPDGNALEFIEQVQK